VLVEVYNNGYGEPPTAFKTNSNSEEWPEEQEQQQQHAKKQKEVSAKSKYMFTVVTNAKRSSNFKVIICFYLSSVMIQSLRMLCSVCIHKNPNLILLLTATSTVINTHCGEMTFNASQTNDLKTTKSTTTHIQRTTACVQTTKTFSDGRSVSSLPPSAA
jgi:hypothetical protein